MNKMIFPPPQTLKFGKKQLQLSMRCYLKLNHHHSARFKAAIARFCEHNPAPLTISYGELSTREILLSVRLNTRPTKQISLAASDNHTSEAYQIECSDAGLLLTADSETGLFRGLMSVQQLLSQHSRNLAFLTLKDAPDFQHRGVMLDISRCKVPTMKTLKSLIDSFALLKYNQLQLYTEHSFAFTQHPLIWANASPFDAADIMEINRYCADRYITLVPNLNCFGHFERWLKHPEYQKYAECPNGFVHPLNNAKIAKGSTLKPNKQSLQLLDALYHEYLPLFDSKQFNVGGDEPWELGQGYSANRCKAHGTTAVYIEFLSKINNLTKKHGKSMMFWSDIVLKDPSCLKKLSKDLTAMIWGYESSHPFKRECTQMAAQNIPYYVCPGTSSWNSLTGRVGNMTKNIHNASKQGLKYGAEGLLITDWGDHGHHQYLPISYPAFVLAGCQSWNHKGSKGLDLAAAINQIYFHEIETTSAQLILDIGHAPDVCELKQLNATTYNLALFSPTHKLPSTNHFSEENITQCENQLLELKEKISILNHLNQNLLRQELGNSLDMAIHGLLRLRHQRGDKNTALSTHLAQITAQHKDNWLARNRVGGLMESVAYLGKSKI